MTGQKCTGLGLCSLKPIVSQTRLRELPTYLFIKLERFNSPTSPKVDTIVVTNSRISVEGQSFSLTAAVEHIGMTANSGHYLTYVRDLSGGGWLRCNDSDISTISADIIKYNENLDYCLFTREELSTPSSTLHSAQVDDFLTLRRVDRLHHVIFNLVSHVNYLIKTHTLPAVVPIGKLL